MILLKHIQASWRTGPVALLMLLLLAVNVAHNINNANLWFDESGQFWMAKGLNHYSDPNAVAGGIGAVVRENSHFNLDPGGYTILLHFWTMLENGPAWLRLLSALFTVAASGCLFALGRKLGLSTLVCVAVGVVPWLWPMGVNFTYEVRAYSMEMAGVIIVPIAMLAAIIGRVDERLDCRLMLSLGLLAGFFMTARYSMVVPCIALFAIFAIHFALMRQGWRWSTARMSLLMAPFIVVAIAIYYFSLSSQSPAGKPPDYIAQMLLRNLHGAGIYDLVCKNLFSPSGAPIIFSCLGLLLALLLSPAASVARRLAGFALSYIVLVNAGFIGLSILGKYPWALDGRWGLPIITVGMFGVAIAFLTLVLSAGSVALATVGEDRRLCIGIRGQLLFLMCSLISLLELVGNRWLIEGSPVRMVAVMGAALAASLTLWGLDWLMSTFILSQRALPSSKFGQPSVGMCTLSFIGLGACALSSYQYIPNDRVADQLNSLNDVDLRSARFYLSRHATPTVRYLFEYGPFKDRHQGTYPYHFILDGAGPASQWDKATIPDATHFIFSHCPEVDRESACAIASQAGPLEQVLPSGPSFFYRRAWAVEGNVKVVNLTSQLDAGHGMQTLLNAEGQSGWRLLTLAPSATPGSHMAVLSWGKADLK